MPTEDKDLWPGDPNLAWQAYEPGRDGPWDLARVAHLHRRAGFGATWKQLQRDVERGHEEAIERLLKGNSEGPDGRSQANLDEIVQVMTESARRDPTLARVRLVWLFRLLHSPHPLQERMTLVWHGHYATGGSKFNDAIAMLDQIEQFHQRWNMPISRMHQAMLDSTAMQQWLDGVNSPRERPNENLGREFLELFALGEEVAFDEADVRAAARALTGYREMGTTSFFHRPIVFDATRHDDGVKTLLGETGPWGPRDLVRIASKQPAAARCIARRLFLTFISDLDPPPVPLIDALASRIRTPDGADVDVAKGLEIVLRSRFFHSPTVRGRKVKSPVDFVVGLVRSIGWYDPRPDAPLLDHALIHMGQTLLDPPTVAGWPGGEAWLGAPFLIARVNLVARLSTVNSTEESLRRAAGAQGLSSPEAWANSLVLSFSGPSARENAPRPAHGDPLTYSEALRQLISIPEAQLA